MELKTRKVVRVAVVVACAFVAETAAANDVGQAKNSYDGAGTGSVTVVVTTWGAIADANGHVYGKRKISATSQVKGWLFDGKGPAKLRNLPVAISNGITTGDRFGLYSMVAQLHWPLERGDKGGASLAAREIVRDVDKLMGFGRA